MAWRILATTRSGSWKLELGLLFVTKISIAMMLLFG
jgi:hypothetical protein